MNKLKELIDKLCPNGVEFKKIAELTSFEQPTKYIVKSTKYDDSYKTPVLTAGQTFILGYTNENDGIYNASKENPVIIFDDFTGAYKWVDFPFKVKSSAMKIITANEDKVLIRFLYHMMGFLNFTSDEHKRLWISIYSQMKIAVPPLEVQCEIVHILDDFTLLSAELSAELEARQKQYEYYRDKLVNTSEKNMTLCEIAKIKNGKDYKSNGDGNIPVYGSGGIIASNSKFAYDKPSVLIPRKGSIHKLYYVDVPFWNVDTIFYTEINTDLIIPKYLYYCLENEHLEELNTAGGVPSLTQSVLNKVKICVPSLNKQKNIVAKLDSLYNLINSISDGLPAEIEKRQKQYEYYCDKLLNFKEAEVNE